MISQGGTSDTFYHPSAFAVCARHHGVQEFHQGRFQESVIWAERLVALWGNSYGTLYALGQAHAVAGNNEAARRVLADLKNLPGSTQACRPG